MGRLILLLRREIQTDDPFRVIVLRDFALGQGCVLSGCLFGPHIGGGLLYSLSVYSHVLNSFLHFMFMICMYMHSSLKKKR